MPANPDVLIVGSGIGGATIAAALAPSGRSIVILERGERLQDSPEARDEDAIFRAGHFRPEEYWLDAEDRSFNPGNYYYVGGNSKFYGAAFMRYRREDFGELRHLGGSSPAWPLSYDEFEPFYQKAEQLYQVRGDPEQDPTEPPHSGAYPLPPVPDEEPIARVRAALRKRGLHPASIPLAVDHQRWLERAPTPWDAFPDTTGAKQDAENVALAQALQYPNVQLLTGARVERMTTDADNAIESVCYRRGAERMQLEPKLVVLAAGAVNSAALLLASADARNPRGLANSSDQLGRNFMNHNASALLALHPTRVNSCIYQKTLYFNDFYLQGGPDGAPLGNVQLLGKISGTILAANSPLPLALARWVARRSVDWYLMSEDLPNPESRVSLTANGQIRLDWRRSNWEAHLELVRQAKAALRSAGMPIVLAKSFDRKTPSHQCGTARFGADPKNNVLDLYCRAHDHANLYVVDASFLPNSAAVNPALTIAAQALRVGAYLNSN